MIEVNQSTMKTVNIHQSKSDVVKFDGTKNWKGKKVIKKSKTDGREDLKKNQCAYCKGEGHWMIDCPKLKMKKNSQNQSQKS